VQINMIIEQARRGFLKPSEQQVIPDGPLGQQIALVRDELVSDRMFEMGDIAPAYMERWMQEVFASKGYSYGQTLFLNGKGHNRVEVEAAVRDDYAQKIAETYAPLVVGWTMWATDVKQRIPGSQALPYPRDGYLPGAAYQEWKVARGMKSDVHYAYFSRVAYGLADELDPESQEIIDRPPEHFYNVLEVISKN